MATLRISIKRAYDTPAPADGYRVLVDRLWPRGLKKEALQLDEWCKEVAPTPDLRTWFAHDPLKFDEFAVRYTDQLEHSAAPAELLKRAEGHTKLTLVYAAKDPHVNHGVILQRHLEALVS